MPALTFDPYGANFERFCLKNLNYDINFFHVFSLCR